MENLFKKKLLNGEKPIGTFFETGNETVAECLARTGMDFVIIDNEHSPAEGETTANIVRVCELTGMTPFARVREISRPAILKLLDVGVQGLIIPCVNSVDDVKKVIEYAKYTPLGNRGYALTRKDGWGNDYGFSVPETLEYFNKLTMVVPQCETVGALENIEQIVALDGVDGIFVGPYDLSLSMGIPGEFDNPEFVAAKKRVVDACHAAGKFCQIFAGSADIAVRELSCNGFDSVAYSLDVGLIVDLFREKLEYIKGKL